jgi:hypothetical protein
LGFERDEKKIIEALLSAPTGVIDVPALVGGFSSGSQMLRAIQSLERAGLVSFSEPTISLTTEAFDRLGHPSMKKKQSLKQRRESILRSIAFGDGHQVELFKLDVRDRGILAELESAGLVVKTFLSTDGHGLYRATTVGIAEAGRIHCYDEAGPSIAESERDEPRPFQRIREHWIFLSLSGLALVGWFLFQNLNPDRICPLLPAWASQWLDRCSEAQM